MSVLAKSLVALRFWQDIHEWLTHAPKNFFDKNQFLMKLA